MRNSENILSHLRTLLFHTLSKGDRAVTSTKRHYLKVVTLSAALVCCLGGEVIASANALSNRPGYLQEKRQEQFVGRWVLTVGDVYDLKDAALPAPFRDLPKGLARNLPLAEVAIVSNGGTLTGKRVLYHYAAPTDSRAPAAEKGEVNLVNIHAQANLLSGDVASPEGEPLPGSWEMKLTGDKEAEVRVTGNDVPDEQKKLVLKLHRLPA